MHLEGGIRQRVRNGSLYRDHIVFWNGNTSLLLVAQAVGLRFYSDRAINLLPLDTVRIPHHFNSVYHSITLSTHYLFQRRSKPPDDINSYLETCVEPCLPSLKTGEYNANAPGSPIYPSK